MTLVVVTLRPVQPEDTADVAEVWQAAWHDGHRGHVPDALIEARDPAYFEARARELVDHVTVAVDGDELLGAAGHDEIWLAVVPGNTSARRFYERRGWVDRGEETYDAVTLGGGTVAVPVCRYVKGLTIANQQLT